MIELSELLDPSRIGCQCDIRSKKRAIQTLAELLAPSVIRDEDDDETSDMDIFDALITRERLGSTALGHGVALPHCRQADVKSPIAAMITLSEGVDYEAPDGEPVDLLVGLLVPKNCNDEHLQILAELAKRFSSDYFRDEVRAFGLDESEALYAFLQKPAPAA